MQRIHKNLTLSIATISQLYLFFNFFCIGKLRFCHLNIKWKYIIESQFC